MHSSTQTALPVLQNERADILDVLRGFALIGVLLDNIFGLTGWGFLTQASRESLPTWPADGIVGLLEQVFISGKFYSLFSLLFGIGFSIILIRNEQKGINPLKVFYRRLFILLLIGAAHLFLLWEGDILFLYALIGMILPLFRKLSDKGLLITAAVLILSPIILDCIYILFHAKSGDGLERFAMSIDIKNGVPTDSTYATYLYKPGSGFHEWRNWQESGWAYRYSYILDSNRIPKVLGMFLLGFYAGRKMMYLQLENYVSLFKKLRLWGFVVGIPAAIACTYFDIFQKHIPNPIGLVHTFFYAISVVPLSLAYTSVICLHWIKRKGNSKLKVLAPVGRMALTNYLMQTIIAITLYYGAGFGFGGNIGPAIFIPIGLAAYALQILYSNWWFKYFNYGPMEWIWRMLTYGKRLDIFKTNSKMLLVLIVVLSGCSQVDSDKPSGSDPDANETIKQQLLSLERKWLEAEFALDTAYLSTLLDSTFIGISANRISGKQEELKSMYDNISAMRQDSIFLDSLKFEDTVVNVYNNSAVATFIVHTFKKEKGKPTEKRTRFYDVWINRNGEWKAVASQGTVLTQDR